MNFQSKKLTYILISILLVLFLISSGLIYFFFLHDNVTQIKAIDFSNMNETEVMSWLSENKVDENLYQIDHQYDEDVKLSYVISQSIKKDEYITEEDPLTIVISNGYDPDKVIELIDFTGMSEDEINNWFTTNKFNDVSYEYAPSDTVAKDYFIKINIDGTSASRSDLIMVTISAGANVEGLEITMPDLKDYTKTNIQAWAKTNAISVTFAEEASDTIEAGKVISQSVKAGDKIITGSKLTVTISSGKGVNITSQVGKTQKEAQSWATNNGLKTIIKEYYNAKASGIVIGQTPSSGTLKANGTITFEVSVGNVPIQDYTGKTKASFVEYINGINSLYNNSAKIIVHFPDGSKDSQTIKSITINNKVISGTHMCVPQTNVYVALNPIETVNVTDFKGKSEDELKKFLQNNSLNIGTRSTQYNDSVSAGYIISNDKGEKEKGSAISYVVSLGPYTFNYGNMIEAGQSYNTLYKAGEEAMKYGWKIEKTDVESTTYNAGIITEKCTVNGKKISCKVSKGKYVTVPDYYNKANPCGVAQSCSVNGLNISLAAKQYSSNVASGNVISQSIEKNTSVLEGSSISLVVSKGACPAGAICNETSITGCQDGYVMNNGACVALSCPADSNGTYPNCTCSNELAQYDKASNSCKIVYGYIPQQSVFDVISTDESSYDERANKAVAIVKQQGFTNVTIKVYDNDVNNPNNFNGVIAGLNVAYGAKVELTSPIEIYIYKSR